MKKTIFLIFACVTLFSCKKVELSDYSRDGITVKNSIVSFADIESYRNYLAKDDKSDIINFIKGKKRNGFDLKKNLSNNTLARTSPDYIQEDNFADLENFIALLNQDGVVIIGDFAFKVDFINERVYTLPTRLINDSEKYGLLLSGNIINNDDIGIFSFEDNALDAIEEGITSTENITEEQARFFCWHRRASRGENITPAYYFKDERWENSSIGLCANAAEGITSNTRLKVKLQYFRAAIYFTLFVKSKHQRETSTNINGDPIFHTTNWNAGLGSQDWNTQYSAIWRGKCRNQSERREAGTIRPSINGRDNEARRVLWESDNGLNYYYLEAQSNINTNTIWKGVTSETYHCTESRFVFTSPTPRMVNTFTDVHPNVKDVIRSNY